MFSLWTCLFAVGSEIVALFACRRSGVAGLAGFRVWWLREMIFCSSCRAFVGWKSP